MMKGLSPAFEGIQLVCHYVLSGQSGPLCVCSPFSPPRVPTANISHTLDI